MLFLRDCPECNKTIEYKTSAGRRVAERESRLCRSCITTKRNLSKDSVLEPSRDFIAHRFEQGDSPYAISKALSTDRETVVKFIEKQLGLEVRRYERFNVEWVDDCSIRCSQCSLVKNKECFLYKGSGIGSSKCLDCISNNVREERLLKPIGWGHKLQGPRMSAKKRGLSFNIDSDYLEWIWDVQKGRCAYTDEEMSRLPQGGLKGTSVSVDRVNNSIGYEPGNVVLCSNRSNTIKHDMSMEELELWMPLWYSNVIKVMEGISDGRKK